VVVVVVAAVSVHAASTMTGTISKAARRMETSREPRVLSNLRSPYAGFWLLRQSRLALGLEVQL
jgi:hypothetical protein